MYCSGLVHLCWVYCLTVMNMVVIVMYILTLWSSIACHRCCSIVYPQDETMSLPNSRHREVMAGQVDVSAAG